MDKILIEFKRRCAGDYSRTEVVCEELAAENGLNPTVFTEWVYTHFYGEDQGELFESDETDPLTDDEYWGILNK